MNFSKRYLFILLSCLISSLALCQQKQGKIQVIARPFKDKILLRWGPDNELAWQYLVKSGIRIERYTISRNGTLINPPEKTDITTTGVKPQPASFWEPKIDTSDYFAIAAQALYGDDFIVNNLDKGNVVDMINLSHQLELRFSFLLFAADQSFEVAKGAALGYEDKTVKQGEKYFYRLFAANATPIKIDTGYVYVGTDDVYELPQPLDLHATFGDKVVSLSWNKLYNEQIYNSYILEKSEDKGQTFKATSNLPFVMTEPDRSNSPTMFRSDSLTENNKSYVYRVRGITPFGEVGPPSETVSGMGVGKTSFQLQIKKSVVINNEQVELGWKVEPADRISDVTTFKVLRSTAVNGKYEVVRDNISPENLSVLDIAPHSTNYYTVSATTKSKQIINSFPILVQLVDSIPPLKPSGLTGEVDTTGVAHLQWKANDEKDLIGYRVYRSNYKSSEFSQITHTFLKDVKFIDSVNVKSLDERIYYKITALDNRFNESEFSAILEIQKPDLIAPTPPIVTNLLNKPIGVLLEWKRSSSNDVKEQFLYRKEGRNPWTKLATFSADSSKYLDERIQPSTSYLYRITAVDEAGNESRISKEVTVRTMAEQDHTPINTLVATPDRTKRLITLGWEYPPWNNIQKFYLFRSANGEPMSFYKALPSSTRVFNDDKIQMSSSYQYRIKVVFKDGSETPFGKEISVQF